MTDMSVKEQMLEESVGPEGTGESCPSILGELPGAVILAVAGAYPIPDNLEGVLSEIADWEGHEQRNFAMGEPGISQAAEARIAVLRDVMLRRPAASLRDVSIRLGWMIENRRIYGNLMIEQHAETMARVRKDLEALALTEVDPEQMTCH